MTLSYKKNIILSFLENLEDEVTAKRLQKLLFIFSRNQKDDRIYDFVPYKYGSFSFQANHDIVALANEGFIAVTDTNEGTDKHYILLHKVDALKKLKAEDIVLLKDVCERYGHLPQDELIAYTYRKWPATAINSKIKEKFLNLDELKKIEDIKNSYMSNRSAVFTIGYEGFSLELYLRRLIVNDVRVLVDVRRNAISRKYGFSKSTLAKACEGVGIKYMHMPELGIESNKRTLLNSQDDYDRLFEYYEATTLIEERSKLEELIWLVDREKRICLTCFERDPRQCHRTRVANALKSMQGAKFDLSHLLL